MPPSARFLRPALLVVGLVAVLTAAASSLNIGPVTALLVWIGVTVGVCRTAGRGFLSFESLYLLLLGSFHLGAVVPASLGVTLTSEASWLSSPNLPTALTLFTCGVGSFAFGTAIAGRGHKAEDSTLVSPRPALFWGGLFTAAVAATLLWSGIVQLGMLSAAYGDFWEQKLSADVRLFGLGLMLFPIGILIAAFGSTRKQIAFVAALFGIVLGPLFLAGFRGHPIVHGVALLTIWQRKDPTRARRFAVMGAIGVMLLAPAVKLARNWEQSFSEAFLSARTLDLVIEAGGSLRALVATVDVVDGDGEPLWLGRSYGMALGRVVPNLSESRAPIEDERALNPAMWITMKTSPWLFERGGGIGFSGVAEPYLNFGTPGIIVVFALLGYVLRRLDRWTARDSAMSAVACSSFGFLLWTVRSDFMGVFRATTLAGIVVLLLLALSRVPRPHFVPLGVRYRQHCRPLSRWKPSRHERRTGPRAAKPPTQFGDGDGAPVGPGFQ